MKRDLYTMTEYRWSKDYCANSKRQRIWKRTMKKLANRRERYAVCYK